MEDWERQFFNDADAWNKRRCGDEDEDEDDEFEFE